MCWELPGLCTLAQVQQKLSLGLQQCNTQINKSARKRPGWGCSTGERLNQTQSRAADSCKTGCIQETRAAPCWYIPAGSSPVHPPQPALPTPRLPRLQGKRHRAELGRGILLLWGISVCDHGNMLREGEGNHWLAQNPCLKVNPWLVEPWEWWGQTLAVLKVERVKIEGTANNPFSPLQLEIIFAFLRAGLHEIYHLPPATKPLFHSWPLEPGRKAPPARGDRGRDLGWQSILQRRNGLFACRSRRQAVSGSLGIPSVPGSWVTQCKSSNFEEESWSLDVWALDPCLLLPMWAGRARRRCPHLLLLLLWCVQVVLLLLFHGLWKDLQGSCAQAMKIRSPQQWQALSTPSAPQAAQQTPTRAGSAPAPSSHLAPGQSSPCQSYWQPVESLTLSFHISRCGCCCPLRLRFHWVWMH